jgi:hypothetical protein
MKWTPIMTDTMRGTVTIVQEGRFQLTDDRGVAHLFILGHAAAEEPSQLAPLGRRQARVSVRYTKSPHRIGNVAHSIALAE